MNRRNRWLIFAALFALLGLLGACKGESPTAPPNTQPGGGDGAGGGGGGGGTPPPSGATIALSVSNPTPLVNSTSVITARVTLNGASVPDGTAVEFSTNLGVFTESSQNSIIRITRAGVSTVTLTSPTAGIATIVARVNNVSNSTTVTFAVRPPDPDPPTPPNTTVTVTSVTPTIARPGGGQTIVITGTNFVAPVRVIFGSGFDARDGIVTEVTPTRITVITPAIDLGAGLQFREVPLVVLSAAGTASEQRVTAPAAFRFELEILTPAVYSISPASGPNEGNTRITIFGEGFQSPVRVFFGTGGTTGNLTNQVEVDVVSVNFGRIIASTPPAIGLGAALRSAQVVVRVLNIASNKEVIIANGFRYGPVSAITAVTQTIGTAFGGDEIKIFGVGFDDPVAVTIAGVGAQVLRVSATEVLVRTGSALGLLTTCDQLVTGPIVVTNIEDGASASSIPLTFTYAVRKPVIVRVVPTVVEQGGTVTVSVVNPPPNPEFVRLEINDLFVLPTAVVVANGVATYTVVAPLITTFPVQACTNAAGVAGMQSLPVRVNVKFTELQLGCSNTSTGALTINPADQTCRIPPPRASVTPVSINFPNQVVGTPSAAQNITVANTGGLPLIITNVSSSNPAFTVNGPTTPATIAPGGSAIYQVRFTPSAATTFNGVISFSTNDPTAALLSVPVTGTGTP